MTITVKSCGDCPFCDGTYCNQLGVRVGHYLCTITNHPSCPLRTEKITVELDEQPEPTTTNQSGN